MSRMKGKELERAALECVIAMGLGRQPRGAAAEFERLPRYIQDVYRRLPSLPPLSPRQAPDRSGHNTVYRVYSADGELAYVGLSLHVAERLAQHRYGSGWWQSASRIELEHFPNRDAASEREKELIAKFRPRLNVLRGGA